MNFQVAVLCDAATDDRGKLNILGAFDTIAGGSFPLVHRQCALALRLQFTSTEEGEHKLSVAIIDADGREVVKPLNIPFQVRFPATSYFASRNLVINLQRLQFKAAGMYSVDLTLDDDQRIQIPLQVIQVQRPRQKKQ